MSYKMFYTRYSACIPKIFQYVFNVGNKLLTCNIMCNFLINITSTPVIAADTSAFIRFHRLLLNFIDSFRILIY